MGSTPDMALMSMLCHTILEAQVARIGVLGFVYHMHVKQH
jgi:hypothetical protein